MEQLNPVGKIRIKAASEIRTCPIGIGFEKLDRNVFSPDKAYDKVAGVGVKWARIQSGWARCESQKGVYDFGWLDDIVDQLLSRRIQPWLCLCYGNSLYTPFSAEYFGCVGCPPISTEEEMCGWLNYVEATVRHFRGRLGLYEVWNEPDLKYSWKHRPDAGGKADPGPSGSEYGEFCLRTAQVIHRADPDARVAGFALGHPYNLDFVADAFSTGLGREMDAVTFHVYSADDTCRPEYIRQLRTLLSGSGRNIELIQGEAGAQSRSDGCGAMRGFAWTPERQCTYLLRGILHDLAAGIGLTSYFSTLDMIEALNGLVADKKSYMDYGYFGVLSADFDENGFATGNYSPKPSYTALGNLVSVFCNEFEPAEVPVTRLVLASRRVNGIDCNDKTMYTYGFCKPDGSFGLAYWNSVPLLTSTYDGTVSFLVKGVAPTELRIADLADGCIYSIPEVLCEQTENGDYILKNLPVTHSPLLLCSRGFLD